MLRLRVNNSTRNNLIVLFVPGTLPQLSGSIIVEYVPTQYVMIVLVRWSIKREPVICVLWDSAIHNRKRRKSKCLKLLKPFVLILSIRRSLKCLNWRLLKIVKVLIARSTKDNFSSKKLLLRSFKSKTKNLNKNRKLRINNWKKLEVKMKKSKKRLARSPTPSSEWVMTMMIDCINFYIQIIKFLKRDMKV